MKKEKKRKSVAKKSKTGDSKSKRSSKVSNVLKNKGSKKSVTVPKTDRVTEKKSLRNLQESKPAPKRILRLERNLSQKRILSPKGKWSKRRLTRMWRSLEKMCQCHAVETTMVIRRLGSERRHDENLL